MAFAPSSLILANYILPINRALYVFSVLVNIANKEGALTLFHKPRKIYVNSSLLLPLKIIAFLFALYGLIDIYNILDSGIATDRWGNIRSYKNEPFSYITTLLVSVTIFSVGFVLCFWVLSASKDKPQAENVDK